MRVNIGAIQVRFRDPTFEADLDISGIVIQSTTPEWTPASVLAHTRRKNTDEDSIIIYKMCSFNSLKISGRAVVKATNTDASQSVQIKLITTETKIRVALKRRIADCTVMHTRVSVHLGDLVWIVSQSQLRAISRLAQSLAAAAVRMAQREREGSDTDSVGSASDLSGGSGRFDSSSPSSLRRERSSSASSSLRKEGSSGKRSKGAGRAQGAGRGQVSVKELQYIHQINNWQEGRASLPSYEVIQDSFHLRSSRVDLQLCDDTSVRGGGVQGSVLLRLIGLTVDVYLDQGARSGRHHWNKCNDHLLNNARWSARLVTAASRTQFLDLPSVSLGGLREMGVVVRVSDFSLEALRTGSDSSAPVLPILACDKKTFSIPDDVHNPAVQVGLTLYRYPASSRGHFLGERTSETHATPTLSQARE